MFTAFSYRSTGKLMEHSGDWIYLAGDPQDKTAKTLFIVEDYIYWPTGDHNAMLRPSDSNHRIYAQYDSGDLNTKHSGFRMFVKLV
jgi:hypothetical protein